MTQDPNARDPFAPGPAATPDAPTDPFPPFGSGSAPATAPTAAVAPPVVRGRRSGASGILNVLLGVAIVVAVGGVAFAAGRATAPASAASNGGFGNGRFGNGGTGGNGPNASGAPGFAGGGLAGGGFGGGGLTIEGTVTAIGADSITLQLTNGQSVTIPVDAQTTWHEREAATPSAVTSGSTVIVQLQGGRGVFGGGGGNGNGNNGNGNGNGGPAASGQPGRTLPAASSITLAPTGS